MTLDNTSFWPGPERKHKQKLTTQVIGPNRLDSIVHIYVYTNIGAYKLVTYPKIKKNCLPRELVVRKSENVFT